MEYTVHSEGIRWTIKKSANVIRYIFALALTVSDILRIHIFDLER